MNARSSRISSHWSVFFRRVLWTLLLGFIVADVAEAQCNVQQIYKLLADDAEANDQFGRSVAISGTTAIVGAPFNDDNGFASGSAYLFDTTTGQQIAQLMADDGAEGDSLGFSVSISGTTAIVGADDDDDNGDFSGSAYLFDTATGQQIHKLLPDDGAEGDHFGRWVAIIGTTAIVGAYHDDDNGEDSGSVYLFDTTSGQQIAKLLPDDGAENDLFGFSVSISDTTAIVGAQADDDNGSGSGSAYLFDTTSGQQIAKLLPDDGAAEDRFGWYIAISDTTAIVGAHGNDDNGGASGSAYLFDVSTCIDVLIGDINQDGVISLLDVAPFVALLSSGEFQAEADINGDGVVSLLDVQPFVGLLSGG